MLHNNPIFFIPCVVGKNPCEITAKMDYCNSFDAYIKLFKLCMYEGRQANDSGRNVKRKDK